MKKSTTQKLLWKIKLQTVHDRRLARVKTLRVLARKTWMPFAEEKKEPFVDVELGKKRTFPKMFNWYLDRQKYIAQVGQTWAAVLSSKERSSDNRESEYIGNAVMDHLLWFSTFSLFLQTLLCQMDLLPPLPLGQRLQVPRYCTLI